VHPHLKRVARTRVYARALLPHFSGAEGTPDVGRTYNFREVMGGSTTGKPAPRLASGAQLWRLNQLGMLGQALNAEEQVPPIVPASC
jgi:hypothetical protein